MRRIFNITVVILLFSLATDAVQNLQNRNQPDGTILLGRYYSFILKEPSGWVMDGTSGKSQGLDAVIYREGSSWKNGMGVMYARVIYKNSKERSDIEHVVQSDVSDFKKANSRSQVSDAVSLATRDKKKAIVKDFYDAENGNYESVAYIDEVKVVVILALSSRKKEDFESSRSAFKDLVGSYFSVKRISGSKVAWVLRLR